jgi:hypothetical protein
VADIEFIRSLLVQFLSGNVSGGGGREHFYERCNVSLMSLNGV